MEFLSVITKGTTEDKLQWAFTFYDVNHDGVISREELIKVGGAKKSGHQGLVNHFCLH